MISFSQKRKEVDVYLIGGKSNATCQGYMKNIPSDYYQGLDINKGWHCKLIPVQLRNIWITSEKRNNSYMIPS